MNSELETLLDERDHLLIQISLAGDVSTATPDKIEELRRELAGIEVEISSHSKNPYA